MMLASLLDDVSALGTKEKVTDVAIPPPPIPASARHAINMYMFCADPHNTQPHAKVVYANRIQLFLPNMSLSLP